MCDASYLGDTAEDWLWPFSGIGVDGLVPEKTGEAREQMKSIWKTVARGPFGGNVNFGSDDEDEDGEE